ncbi:hypothetical protein Q7P35_001921 [Cladosporium inversicolor]
MDEHDQGEVVGFSPAYASPHSSISDTKVRVGQVVSQPSAKELGKKTIELVVRPKLAGDLPDYSGRAKAGKDAKTLAMHSRGVVSHAKTSTSIAEKAQAVKQPSYKPLYRICPHPLHSKPREPTAEDRHVFVCPHPLISKPREPTAEDRHVFHARIKLDDRLQDELAAGVYDPSRPYLTQSIATGDWPPGVSSCTTCTYHPSGTWRDFAPEDEDLDDKEDSEYFDVEVLLLRCEPVEPVKSGVNGKLK